MEKVKIEAIDYLEFLTPTNKSCTKAIVSKISIKDAIKSSKESAKRKNYTYKTDENALWDFVANYWAKVVLKKGKNTL